LATEQATHGRRPFLIRIRELDPAIAGSVGLLVMVLASFGGRLWLAWRVPTPWIMVDELIYSEMAKSLAASGHFLIRGGASGISSVGYPFLISPGWLFGPVATAYGIAKAVNAVLVSLTAIPTYFWAARLVRNRWLALTASALVLLMPALLYSGMLMTENAFLPTFVLASWAIAVALERPTLLTQLAALGAIGLVCAFRIQGIVLLLVLPTALLLKFALDIRAEPSQRHWRPVLKDLGRFWSTAVVLGIAFVGYIAYKVAHGASLSSGLGDYSAVATTHYSFHDGARWVLYHLAELPLVFGVVPACAFLVLLVLAVWRGTPSPQERAFLAVTTSALVWVVLEVALFASRFSLRVEERYMFALGPLFMVALVLWLDRGVPRPLVPAVLAAAIPAALLATLPLGSLLNVSIFSDTFGLVPFLRQTELHGLGYARALLLGGAAAAGVLFLLVPRRVAPAAIPLAIAVFLSLTTHSVDGAIRGYAGGLSAINGFSGDHSWIDDAVGRDANVGYLYGTSTDLFAEASLLWQTEFWNRSVRRVYNLGSPEPVGFLETTLKENSATGRLAGASGAAVPTYMAVANGFEIGGTVVARHPPFVLYRVAPPLRLGSSIQGVYGDTWMGEDASYLRFTTPGNRRGIVQLTLSRAAWGGPDVPGHVRIQVSALRKGKALTTTTRRWVIHSSRGRVFSLPTPRPPFEVTVHVQPTFSPSRFGFPDTRELGAQASFAFLTTRRTGT
jgi:hypothetical protein